MDAQGTPPLTIWLDVHLSPAIGAWITDRFGVPCRMLRDMGHVQSEDDDVFEKARSAGIVMLTKDADFAALVARHGPPPQVLMLRCGNTSNARLREILGALLVPALDLLRSGEPLVEIGSPS